MQRAERERAHFLLRRRGLTGADRAERRADVLAQLGAVLAAAAAADEAELMHQVHLPVQGVVHPARRLWQIPQRMHYRVKVNEKGASHRSF